MAVSKAGGAVGFTEDATAAEVRTLADPAFARVEQGSDDLVVAFDGEDPVGMAFLATNAIDIQAHWATVKRLQRHPDRRASGVGGALLRGIEDAAVDRGISRIVLTVRGGTGREGFYAAHGYRVEAILPERIKLGPDDIREELVMAKNLSGTTGPALQLQRLDPDLPLPAYAHEGDAGLDLYAREDTLLAPGERAVVPTGVAVAVPPGHVGLVQPRSGLAARSGVGVVNAPGTIDEGYRGEIKVILVNLDPAEPVSLRRGDRIAQLVIQRVERVAVTEVSSLTETARGRGGFGSSGR